MSAYGTPWEYENVSVCSERSAYGLVRDDNGKALFDTMNSDVATIGVEHDENGATYHDTAGRFYLTHVVHCVNAHDGLLASLEEFRAHLLKHATLGINDEERAMLIRSDAAVKKAKGA